MRLITVVGKIDSRALVYSMARALGLNGLTAVITDDGSYRRLFHGKEDIGTVSNVDISVGGHVNKELMHSLDDSGLDYDNIILVSSDFIPEETSGLVICHGVDRSMMVDLNSDEDLEFDFSFLEKDNKSKEKDNDSKKNDSNSNEIEILDLDRSINRPDDFRSALIKNQNNNPDKIVIPKGMKYVEVEISYSEIKKGNIPVIQLKDGILQYIYHCEEEKKLLIYNEKNYIMTVAKIISGVTDISEKDAYSLLMREEGKAGALKKK